MNELLKDFNGKAGQDLKLFDKFENHLEEALSTLKNFITDNRKMMNELQKIFAFI